MDKILLQYLTSSPILSRCNLSDQEVADLAVYLRKHCLSTHIEEVVRMVEEVISINPALEWKEILEAAANKMVRFLNAAAASIRIFDPQTGRLVAFGSFQYAEKNRQESIPLEQSVAGRVITSGKSFLVPNILFEPDYKNKDIVREHGFNSLMAIPIHIPGFLANEGDIQGTIQIYYKENDKEFDPLEVANAELMSRRVSYVLAKKRILDLQKLNIQKEKIVEKIFVKLSHREGIKMGDVFRMMIPELVTIIQIQSCALFSVTPDRKYVRTELEYPVGQDIHDPSCRFSVKDHPYFDVLINQSEQYNDYEFERINASYIFIKDPLKSGLADEELKRYAARHGIQSVLLIPLRAKDEINYFIVFYNTDRRREFTDHEIELLNFFGKEIMKALRIEKLDDVLHDFKNPGIAIAGFAKRARKLLQTEDLNSVKDRVNEYLDIITQETARMQELAIYPNIEGRERVLDLTLILKNRFRINEEAIREQKRTNIILIQDELQPQLFVFCSPFGFERVLDNLLDNATKAIPEQGGELAIRSYRSDDMACFEIRNTGRIPQEKILQIQSGEVKGRGLNIIYRFIQAIHGKLEVSTDDHSTTFRVSIPTYKETE